MDITFENPGFIKMLDSIMAFHTDGETEYWTEPLFIFYPDLDKEKFKVLNFEQKKIYLSEELKKIYLEQEEALEQKAEDYNRHWKKYKSQIESALSDAFDIDVTVLFNDLRGEISLNPICPRYLRERYFQVFYLNSERGALGMSLHEIIHYLWFYVWNQEFDDDYDDYERPSLKWILSEMVVESIMKDERLSSINPYFPGTIYDYFQTMKIGDTMILDELDELYKCGNMKKFMHDSYDYCIAHEEEIRLHISKSENI